MTDNRETQDTIEIIDIVELRGIGKFVLEVCKSRIINGECLNKFKFIDFKTGKISGDMRQNLLYNDYWFAVDYDDPIIIHNPEIFASCTVSPILQCDIEMFRKGLIKVGLKFHCRMTNNPFFRTIILGLPFTESVQKLINALDRAGILDIEKFAETINSVLDGFYGGIETDNLKLSFEKIYESLTDESKLKVELLTDV